MNTKIPVIIGKRIVKSFKNGESEQVVLKGVDINVYKGEFLTIFGRSGAGKSTLLYQLGLLDHPTSGEIHLLGQDTSKLTSSERTSFRLTKLGYVFQDYAILPELTALENVMLPLIMQGIPTHIAREQSITALNHVNLGHRLNNPPSKLSGGEQQRVSIARAVAHTPEILFADEPTANLDSETAANIMDLFQELHQKKQQTIVMITHEDEFKGKADRSIFLSDGRIEKFKD